MTRPTLFIGSSNEGKEIARAIQAELADDVTAPHVWYQGTFGLMQGGFLRVEVNFLSAMRVTRFPKILSRLVASNASTAREGDFYRKNGTLSPTEGVPSVIGR